MEVKKILKTKNGLLEFKGELSSEEHEFILSLGLNALMEAGALSLSEEVQEVTPAPPGELH